MLVVYFSGIANNTERFVTKLGVESRRIPLMPNDPELEVDEGYILITPTYGAGRGDAVPKQVIRFLNNHHNRLHIQGVVAGGAIYFGDKYGIAGDVISEKCGVPLLHKFDLAGTPQDVEIVLEKINDFARQPYGP